MLVPQLVSTLRAGYDRRQFGRDLAAGVVVGIVAIPLAIAFAIASGVTPERGLWTAIVAGFLISVLSGSKVQIGGPTGAFVVIVYGVVQKYGLDGLMVATLMAGALLVVLGIVRLGAAIKFIPHPVIVGFTSGIAVIIFSSQVKDVLGLQMGTVPAEFIEKWAAYAGHLGAVNPWAILTAGIALTILVGWPRVDRRLPAPFVALVATTMMVRVFELPVETIGSRFGEISASIPRLTMPSLTLEELRGLVAPAFTIAMLAGIESLLSAMVADGMIGDRHRSNMELVAQGVANLVTPLFGGIPATGAIARTATNVKNGGRTPIAGIVHAFTLLLVTLFFGRLAGFIPMATLGAILIMVSYQMSEWRSFRSELSAPKSDVAVLLSTFFLTVLVDLTVAIQVGIVLASFLFMKRMSDVTNVSALRREFADEPDNPDDPRALRRYAIPKGVEVYEIDGPFFFGAAETFKETIGQVAAKPRVLIIRMRDVPAIDSTGIAVLHELAVRGRREGTRVMIADVHAQPLVALGKADALDDIGDENLFGSLADALIAAQEHIATLPPRKTGEVPAAAGRG
jgi:SulP family sulfate permease